MGKKKPVHRCVIPSSATIFSGVPEAIFHAYACHPNVKRGDSRFIHDFMLLTIAEATRRRAVYVPESSPAAKFMASVRHALKEWTQNDVGTKEMLKYYRRRVFKDVLKSIVLASVTVL